MQLDPSSTLITASSFDKVERLLLRNDLEGALTFFKEAGKKGDMMACFYGGLMMIRGIGCTKDVSAGVEMMKKGAALKEILKGDERKCYSNTTEAMIEQLMNLPGLFFSNVMQPKNKL